MFYELDSAFIRKTPENFFLTHSIMWEHSEKMTIYKSRMIPHQSQNLPVLILSFSAFRIVRNKCLLFKPSSLWYFCYSSVGRLRQGSFSYFHICRNTFYEFISKIIMSVFWLYFPGLGSQRKRLLPLEFQSTSSKPIYAGSQMSQHSSKFLWGMELNLFI